MSVVKVATFGVVPMTGGDAHVEPCRVEELRLATWDVEVVVRVEKFPAPATPPPIVPGFD